MGFTYNQQGEQFSLSSFPVFLFIQFPFHLVVLKIATFFNFYFMNNLHLQSCTLNKHSHEVDELQNFSPERRNINTY
jgi:hypothetical protein